VDRELYAWLRFIWAVAWMNFGGHGMDVMYLFKQNDKQLALE